MNLIKEPDNRIVIILTTSEQKVIDWITLSKLKLFLEDFLKQRETNMNTMLSMDFIRDFDSMSESKKIEVKEIVRRNKT